MKISASKKQLAKIISENGGWHEEATWAAQDRVVAMYSGGKPRYHSDCSELASNADNGCCVWVIRGFAKLPQWHQTALHRDEYFHLYPAPDADGWIEWKGGECPVEDDVIVDVKTRDGEIEFDSAYFWNWSHERDSCIHPRQITAYRLHKSEKQKSTAVGDDETNLAAKEELEALELDPTKPTIEQLAADYRAKLSIARQAQEEADSHRCGAEAALERLHQAGMAIGLNIAIAD